MIKHSVIQEIVRVCEHMRIWHGELDGDEEFKQTLEKIEKVRDILDGALELEDLQPMRTAHVMLEIDGEEFAELNRVRYLLPGNFGARFDGGIPSNSMTIKIEGYDRQDSQLGLHVIPKLLANEIIAKEDK
jgi:hypothetical protein